MCIVVSAISFIALFDRLQRFPVQSIDETNNVAQFTWKSKVTKSTTLFAVQNMDYILYSISEDIIQIIVNDFDNDLVKLDEKFCF